ncbi:hypothetical protein UA08_06396 [Talaromyces atroroseus]|uniref:Histone chaperone domain-containing protein n=1 Tax=Talaromyces atroroseus TaxID=1441469 RepID=A0A225AUR8_TALAT|nr:hypothetical protein UA08_06396 [Talaromyces atroroseus]OKL58185.1 hypothetical protein UA08_06396 [Talaromyces atroroseus]
MSNRYEREAEDRYEEENDLSPVTGDFKDSSYTTDQASRIPVQSDNKPYDDPFQPPQSNSNQQLEQDERDAIDPSNILQGDRNRLRHAKPKTANRYNEGPNEDDIPYEAQYTGQSSTR